MTKFSRRGHWRTNGNGTTTWISEHKVEKQHYSLVKRGENYYLDGDKRLLQDTCKYCYQKIYYVAFSESRKVYFNSFNEPLKIHNCRKSKQAKKIQGSLKKTNRFLSELEAETVTKPKVLKHSFEFEAVILKTALLENYARAIEILKSDPVIADREAQLPKIFSQATLEIKATENLLKKGNELHLNFNDKEVLRKLVLSKDKLNALLKRLEQTALFKRIWKKKTVKSEKKLKSKNVLPNKSNKTKNAEIKERMAMVAAEKKWASIVKSNTT